MPISQAAWDSLKELARAMVQQPESSANLVDVDLTGGFKQGALPGPVQRVAGDGETLVITGEEFRLYDQVLLRLSAEKDMEHLTVRDIDTELWGLVCELFVRREEYRNDTARLQAIRRFLARLQKPWQEYEVIAAIHDLDLRVRVLDIVGVRLCTLSRQAAADWGLGGSPRLNDFAQDLVGRTTAFTVVKAGSPGRAVERARIEIDDALNTLRFALAGSILANIPDAAMLFRRGEASAVKARSSGRIELINWRRGFKPMGFEVHRRTADSVRRYLEPINALVEGQTPGKLRSRLLRALHWIGTSITRESHDDKIIDLCTALETLLTSRSDERKAEAVALRSILLAATLGQAFSDPFPVYQLYERRSEIVHGSALRVCGQKDYAHLLWIATTIATQFAELAGRNSSITTHAKLIAAIERPDLLSQVIAWLEPYPDPVPRSVAKFAHERLNPVQCAN
jgi:hypothetical protein